MRKWRCLWRCLALAPVAWASPEAERCDALLAWLRGRGAVFGAKFHIGVDAATGLRGVLAGERIARGTNIFELPASLVLTGDAVQEQGTAWQQCRGSSGSSAPAFLAPLHTAFALFLLEQRAPGSAWGPWVAALPESFPGFPLYYGGEELDGLQASPVRRVIELDQDAVAQDHATAASAWPGLTLDDFRWARTAVKSRVFGLRSLSGGLLEWEVIAMVPLADFVNHPLDGVVEANVEPAYDVGTGAFRLTAVRDIGPRDGIYWDYGFRSNRHSLLRHGFVSRQRIALTDMPLFFRLSDFPGPPGIAKAWKLELMARAQQEGLLAAEPDGTVLHELGLSLAGPSAEKLLGHLRFMVVQPRNATALQGLCPGSYCGPAGLAAERQALGQLAALLEALLASYNTTAAQDSELLGSGAVSPSDGAAWQALVLRLGEKQVLRGFGRLLGALDALFDLSPWALARAVAERWNNSGSDIHRYVQENISALVEQEGLRWAKRKLREERAKARGGGQ